MQYASMYEHENITPADARAFVIKLANLRLYSGVIYVQPMSFSPMEGDLPTLSEFNFGDGIPLNLQLKVRNVAANSERYINIASLKRQYGTGTINELGSVSEQQFISKSAAMERIPGFYQAVEKLIQQA
jgi:hypothetical protein